MAQSAAGSLAPEGLLSLADINFFLVNKLVVLVVVMLFFIGVIVLRRSRGETIPPAAGAALKLSLLGMLLLYFEASLSGYPNYRAILASLQGVIVLVCLAKLVIYLIVDVVLSLRRHGEVPMLLGMPSVWWSIWPPRSPRCGWSFRWTCRRCLPPPRC